MYNLVPTEIYLYKLSHWKRNKTKIATLNLLLKTMLPNKIIIRGTDTLDCDNKLTRVHA